MRQLFLDRSMLVVKEVSEPLLEENSLLVAVRYSCMNARTDAHLQIQRNLLENVPLKVKKLLESVATHGVDTTTALVKGKLQGDLQAFGSSCSGIVVAVGSRVKQVQVGDLVACAGIGFAHHAHIVCVPEHLTARIHNQTSLRHASMAAVGISALYGIHRAQVQLGETVGVFGLDLVGQLIAQLAQRSGALVIACDASAERRQMALKCGITTVVTPDHMLTQHLNYFTHHRGLDAAYITSTDAQNYAPIIASCTRRAGRVVLYTAPDATHTYAPFYEKDITVCSPTYGSSWQNDTDYPYELQRWTEQRHMQLFVDLIERDQLTLEPLIAHDITLDMANKLSLDEQPHNELASLITYPDHTEHFFKPAKVAFQAEPKIAVTKFVPAQHNLLRIAVVGASEIVRSHVLPLLSSINRVQVTTIVDSDNAKSLSIARQYNAAHALTNEADIVAYDLADVVIIASPHAYHTEHALHAMKGGKAVFVEKPCAINTEQLDTLTQFLYKNPLIPFCIDYNRSFSPFIQKIKKVIAKRSTPLVINYRMNVGFMPQESWTHRNMGSGRIIGEACYVIDLLCHIVNSTPFSVSVESMHTSDPTLFPTDNFTAHIRFRDGSLCSLVYTSIGHSKLGKERMEIFFDSKSIVMDDFEYLAGNGLRRSFDETVTTPDKGHHALLTTFIDQLLDTTNSYQPLITPERLYMGTALTLSIDRLACQGGGTHEFAL